MFDGIIKPFICIFFLLWFEILFNQISMSEDSFFLFYIKKDSFCAASAVTVAHCALRRKSLRENFRVNLKFREMFEFMLI